MTIAASAPIASEAWIDPRGTFYPVRDYGHSAFANEYLLKQGHTQEEAWRGVDHLERIGWIHVSGGCLYIKNVRNLTSAQADTLFATLAAYRNAGYPFTSNLESAMRAIMNGEED